MRALLRAGGECEGSAMHHQLTWLVSQYVQVRSRHIICRNGQAAVLLRCGSSHAVSDVYYVNLSRQKHT